jgi:tricorn protease
VGFQTISLYSLDQDRSFPLTDGLAEAGEPVFDVGGKYLFFLALTDAGPVKNWFDQSFTDMPLTMSLYLVTLQKSTPNPLLKESDEETAEGADKGNEDSKSQKSDSKSQEESRSKDQGDTTAQKKDEPKGPEKNGRETSKGQDSDSAGKSADSKESTTSKASKPVVIDLEGISGRIVSLPIEEGLIIGLKPGAEGQVYYIRRTTARPARGEEGVGKPSLRRVDLKTREEETLADGIDDFHLSADHKKILYRAGEVAGMVDAGKFNKGHGALAAIGAISIRIEPRAEWAQMFREAWRINRDYFYATNMHGADWNAVRSKYEALLPHLASRGDLDRLNPPQATRLQPVVRRVSPVGLQPVPLSRPGGVIKRVMIFVNDP